MIKQNNKSIETEIDLRKTDKKSVFNGSVIAFFILATPFLFYSYKSFPDVKVWEDGAWSSEMTINLDSNKVVDNAQLAPSDIFPYLATSSFSMFYERVKAKSISNVSWKLIKKFN